MILAVVAILAASLATLHAVEPVLGSGLLVRQVLWGAAGLTLLWLLSLPNLTFYERIAPFAYGLGVVALVAVLLFGEIRGGSRAWFAIGPLTIQPSEFARLGVILLLAAWLGRRRSQTLTFREGLIISTIVGAAALLVVVEPDLGVALTYLPLIAVALWIGGVPTRTWLVIAVLTLVGAGVLWQAGLKPYQKERVLTVMDPERDPTAPATRSGSRRSLLAQAPSPDRDWGRDRSLCSASCPRSTPTSRLPSGRRGRAFLAPPCCLPPTVCWWCASV